MKKIFIFILIIIAVFFYNNKEKAQIYYEMVVSYITNILNSSSPTEKNKQEKNEQYIVKIENKTNKKCEKEIESKLQKLKNSHSLIKSIHLLRKIEKESNICGISITNKKHLINLYNNYLNIIKIINNLSFNNMNKNIASKIILVKYKIKYYSEYKKINSLLNKKIEQLANSVEKPENINKLLKFINFLNINNPNLIKKLKNKLAYKYFEDDLNNLDYIQAVKYIKNNYQNNLDYKKGEIQSIIQNKFNSYVEKIISDSNKHINSESDLDTLKEKISYISHLINTNIDTIDYTPQLSNDLKKKYEKLKKLYSKYNSSAKINYIAFYAEKNDIKPLNFDCDSIDNRNGNIILKISRHKEYRWDKGGVCLTNYYPIMKWKTTDYFEEGSYDVTVIEKDTLISDDVYTSYLELDKNDIIHLINGNEIDKDIGNNYHIVLSNKK